MWLKRLMPLSRQARMAAAVLPSGVQFRCALAMSRLQGYVMGSLGSNPVLTEAMMRDHWVRELSFWGGFPIPWRLHGRDVLDHYNGLGPILYYTLHAPLCEMPLRVVMELGYPVPIPLADPGRLVEQDKLLVPGMETRIPSLSVTDSPLLRVRTLLRRGQGVVCLADRCFAGAFYTNPMRLTARLGVPVIFSWAELGPDGVVDVTFQPVPYPLCETEKAIAQNLSFLEEIRDRLLRSLGVSLTPEKVTEIPITMPSTGMPEPLDVRSA
jgi:hypothetical protein